MPVTIKSEDEIAKMKVAGHLAAEVLELIATHIEPGITTAELDDICHRHIVDTQQAIPAPLNYHGFPKSICTSINHVVCHGIPADRKLRDGDIVNVDITVIKDGYHGDTSKMFIVGNGSVKARRLVDTAYECLCLGIDMVRPGVGCDSETSVPPSNNTPNRENIQSYESIAATASAWNFTKNHRCCITVHPEPDSF